jgi:hypothetical protein
VAFSGIMCAHRVAADIGKFNFFYTFLTSVDVLAKAGVAV